MRCLAECFRFRISFRRMIDKLNRVVKNSNNLNIHFFQPFNLLFAYRSECQLVHSMFSTRYISSPLHRMILSISPKTQILSAPNVPHHDSAHAAVHNPDPFPLLPLLTIDFYPNPFSSPHSESRFSIPEFLVGGWLFLVPPNIRGVVMSISHPIPSHEILCPKISRLFWCD